MSLPNRPATIDVADIRQRFSGRVFAPGDEGYDAARAAMLGGIDRRPAVIVRVANADDASRVVTLARETGLELAVRAGGHSGASHSSVDGGILLDVRDLTTLEIDHDGLTAWAGAGLTALAYTEAVAEHGLATGFGDTGSVGIAGITLGGGIGYLVRKHGLTIDNLLAAEVVTADGRIHLVDADHEPDLFWAIRGGAGNAGVVTRFQYRLHPLGEVTGGMLLLPATAASLAGVIRVLDEASDELSAIVNVMPCPPMPFVPEAMHGQVVLLVQACHAGPADAAAAELAGLRALAEPIADLIRPIRYPELYPPEPESDPPLLISRTLYLDRFDEAAAASVLDGLAACDAPMRVVQLRVLGGAAARVPVEATAYAHRERKILGYIVAIYAQPADLPAMTEWADAVVGALHPAPGAYVNFLGDEGEAQVRQAFPGATWDRLADIKRRYDPDNLYRRVQNVPPAPAP